MPMVSTFWSVWSGPLGPSCGGEAWAEPLTVERSGPPSIRERPGPSIVDRPWTLLAGREP